MTSNVSNNVVNFPIPEKGNTVREIDNKIIDPTSNALETRIYINKKARDGNYVRLLTGKSTHLFIIGASITGKKKNNPKLRLKLTNYSGKKMKDIIINIDDNGELYNVDKDNNRYKVLLESKKTILGQTGILHDIRLQKNGFNPDWLK